MSVTSEGDTPSFGVFSTKRRITCWLSSTPLMESLALLFLCNTSLASRKWRLLRNETCYGYRYIKLISQLCHKSHPYKGYRNQSARAPSCILHTNCNNYVNLKGYAENKRDSLQICELWLYRPVCGRLVLGREHSLTLLRKWV